MLCTKINVMDVHRNKLNLNKGRNEMLMKNQKLKNMVEQMDFNLHHFKHDERHRRQPHLPLVNLIAALLIFAMLCAGCSGDGSSSSGSSTTTASGVVADGYLVGARVFLDLNDNRIWDSGEPYAISDADGSYSISGIAQEDYNSYPVVAEITMTTTDHDTGQPVSHPYTLVAPAGYPDFISPLTTMVQLSCERNPGLTVDEAHAAVKEMLAMDDQHEVDLFADYIEEKEDSDVSAADYAKLHNIAQLSARIMGANISAMETAAGIAMTQQELEEAKDEILRIAVQEIMQSMDLIVEAATEDKDFDADQEVQALAIQVDTTNISADIRSDETAKLYAAPSLSYAAVFRNHSSGGFNDMLCLGLEHDLNLTGYTFTVKGPDGIEYNFEEDDRDLYASDPIAWYKVYDSLPEGEYAFYITVPTGQKIEVARDTHVHTNIPALSLASAEVFHITGADSRVYHDLLEGTYYYRMLIKEKASDLVVYNTQRRERNIQSFPSKYSTGDYAYRIEAWDHPLLKDATARYRTQYEDIAPATNTETYVEYFTGYHRNRGDEANPNLRLVLDIDITNPSDLTNLTLTGPPGSGISYTFDLATQPNENVYEDASDPRTHFWRGSGTTEDGKETAEYYLQLRPNPNPLPSGIYTWTANTTSGGTGHIQRSVTIYDRKALPAVDSNSVTVTEDQYGDVTFDWDAVDSPDSATNIYYRVVLVRDEDWDNQYYSLPIPGTSWKGSRADIEEVIGGPLDGSDGSVVQYSIHVVDAQYSLAVQNRTDFPPVDLPTDGLK